MFTESRLRNYYFIKYDGFRNSEDGYYFWPKPNNKYECVMMRRKTLGGCHWDPVLFSMHKEMGEKVQIDNYGANNCGAPLLLVTEVATFKLTNWQEEFHIRSYDEGGEEVLESMLVSEVLSSSGSRKIKQSTEGFDLEDRVQVGVKIIEELVSRSKIVSNKNESLGLHAN